MKIEWLTKSSSMYDYFVNNQNCHLRGGRVYEIEAINALKDSYDVTINKSYIKHENAIRYFCKNHTRYISADICVLDPFIIAMNKFDKTKINIAMVHHIDKNKLCKTISGSLLYSRLINNLRKVDKVILVSKYWQEYLNELGIIKTEVIYNSYNKDQFEFSNSDIENFKNANNLNLGKPIIYLGPQSEGKGIDETLSHLDFSKYQIILTGKLPYPDKRVIVKYFSKDEYPLFLASCDLVLAMSSMPEGWNRVAHESMLAGTPVIGSGVAGMGELLKGGEQLICANFDHIENDIEKVLQSRQLFVEKGRRYVKSFDSEYFKESWHNVIREFI